MSDHPIIDADGGHCPFTLRMLAERDHLSDSLESKILYEKPARPYGRRV